MNLPTHISVGCNYVRVEYDEPVEVFLCSGRSVQSRVLHWLMPIESAFVVAATALEREAHACRKRRRSRGFISALVASIVFAAGLLWRFGL